MYNLKKKNIIKSNKIFQQVYKCGKSYANRYMVIYVFKKPAFLNDDTMNVGFAAGKRLGNAVTRNRVKRLMRETYRLNRKKIKLGIALILVGRKPLTDVKYDIVEKSFLDLCRRAQIFAI